MMHGTMTIKYKFYFITTTNFVDLNTSYTLMSVWQRKKELSYRTEQIFKILLKYSSSCNCLLFLIHLPFVTTYSLFQNDIIKKFYSSILQCYAVDNHRPITFSIVQQISHMAEVGLIFCSVSLLIGQYIYQRTAECRRVT
jgi:hypothetical protein